MDEEREEKNIIREINQWLDMQLERLDREYEGEYDEYGYNYACDQVYCYAYEMLASAIQPVIERQREREIQEEERQKRITRIGELRIEVKKKWEAEVKELEEIFIV